LLQRETRLPCHLLFHHDLQLKDIIQNEPQKHDNDYDDFGDFDAAATMPQLQAKDDVTFGQFDKALSQTEDTTEELDDFG
jgi:hypothetical protein